MNEFNVHAQCFTAEHHHGGNLPFKIMPSVTESIQSTFARRWSSHAHYYPLNLTISSRPYAWKWEKWSCASQLLGYFISVSLALLDSQNDACVHAQEDACETQLRYVLKLL